jgi:hypothetical protein
MRRAGSGTEPRRPSRAAVGLPAQETAGADARPHYADDTSATVSTPTQRTPGTEPELDQPAERTSESPSNSGRDAGPESEVHAAPIPAASA